MHQVQLYFILLLTLCNEWLMVITSSKKTDFLECQLDVMYNQIILDDITLHSNW